MGILREHLILDIYIVVLISTSLASAFQCNNVQVVSRAEWNASAPGGRENMMDNRPYVTIHHTAGPHCFNLSSCKKEVKRIQDFHQGPERKWWDIGYNFLIGEDGRAYEGRGWLTKGAHAGAPFNTLAYGISIMGDFSNLLPNQMALDAFNSLVECGINNSRILSNYSLIGHRQARRPYYTTCPGKALYCHIQSWDHFKPYQFNGTFDNNTCHNESITTQSSENITMPTTLGSINTTA
ncbi:unnamed protein product, partial [Owenia fusiformis]